jgi:transglutaminase-like putative cysteine protease
MLPMLLLAASVGVNPNADAPSSAKLAKPSTTTVEFRVAVTAPQNTKKLAVWVPVPPSDETQTVKSAGFRTFPLEVQAKLHTEDVFGNTFAYFEFDNPQGAQIITHSFTCTTHELNWQLDPAKVDTVATWPKAFDKYRRGEQLIKVDDQYLKLAQEIAVQAKNTGERVNAINDWVQQNLTYDHSNTSLIASSDHALTKKRGDCSDYHGLCSSLGRSLGVPTRVTYGLHLFPKNLPVHCKLEAYLPPYGWVSFDVSETQRLIKKMTDDKALSAEERNALTMAATVRLRGGFRDNTWLLVTRGTDYELAPKATDKVPLVSTIYAEADGKPLPQPDPADPTKREFSWMTSHKYTSEKPQPYPFREYGELKK